MSGNFWKQHAHDDFETYHWHGQGQYNNSEDGAQLARVRLEQPQHRFETTSAACNVRALAFGAAGRLFTLSEHPQPAMNHEVLILSTTVFLKENPSSTGSGEHTDWRIDLTLAPSQHQYRPERITPLPQISGPQTAVVTGPAGQEIWVNDLGEVKVQFHWDRYGKNDENSSRWIRVASSCASSNWGEVMVPRIGQDVIVSHLDGNPDHPLITGRVVNSSQLPPSFSHTGNLPGNHTVAGMKSKEHKGSLASYQNKDFATFGEVAHE